MHQTLDGCLLRVPVASKPLGQLKALQPHLALPLKVVFHKEDVAELDAHVPLGCFHWSTVPLPGGLGFFLWTADVPAELPSTLGIAFHCCLAMVGLCANHFVTIHWPIRGGYVADLVSKALMPVVTSFFCHGGLHCERAHDVGGQDIDTHVPGQQPKMSLPACRPSACAFRSVQC